MYKINLNFVNTQVPFYTLSNIIMVFFVFPRGLWHYFVTYATRQMKTSQLWVIELVLRQLHAFLTCNASEQKVCIKYCSQPVQDIFNKEELYQNDI